MKWVPVALGALLLPVLMALVFSKWGVAIAVFVAFMVALGTWVWRKGFLFIEVVAFLIHFDGLGKSPVTLGRVVALCAMGLLLYKFLVEKWKPPAVPIRHWAPVMMLLIWGVSTGAWSQKVSGFLFGLAIFAMGLVFFGITGFMVDSHDKILKYLRAYWYGGLCGSAFGVVGLAFRIRSAGFIGDPNYFGLLQASMVPLTVYYRRNAATLTEKRLYTAALVLVLGGAAGAGSRSGLIGLAITIVATMVTRPGLDAVGRAKMSVYAVFTAAIAFGVGFVSNPANLMRGFSDRGAGRLDFWNVTTQLIQQHPITGWGFGQIRFLIIPNLLVTPGSQALTDTRPDVSAHNTFLDVLADTGVIGLVFFVAIFLVAMYGYIKPRWPQARELSTTMVVMMLPVLSGSNFLPLLSNKLMWSLIGLSAALHVPSWQSRWSNSAIVQSRRSGGSAAVAVHRSSNTEVEAIDVRGPASGPPGDDPPMTPMEQWASIRLAKWDLRTGRELRRWLVVGAVLGGVLFGVVVSRQPPTYSANAGVFVSEMDNPEGTEVVRADTHQIQVVLTMTDSYAYAAELRRLAGLDLSIQEIRDNMSVIRVEMGNYLEITYTDVDRDRTLAVLPQLIPALDAVFQSSQDFAAEQMADEVRQMFPGEQRYYTGDFYISAYDDAVFEEVFPKTTWVVLVGMAAGALSALGLVLSGQRRPRVNVGDDLQDALGLSVWGHIGQRGRRHRATFDQYAQPLRLALDVARREVATRIAVVTPTTDEAASAFAQGVAVTAAAEGARVVFVDAQLHSAAVTRRLVGRRAKGLAEVARGASQLDDVVRPLAARKLPKAVRSIARSRSVELQFLPAGQLDPTEVVDLHESLVGVLEQFPDDVTLVVLAPPVHGDLPLGPLLEWSQIAVLSLVEGRTATADAEDAAAMVHGFAGGVSGAAVLDV